MYLSFYQVVSFDNPDFIHNLFTTLLIIETNKYEHGEAEGEKLAERMRTISKMYWLCWLIDLSVTVGPMLTFTSRSDLSWHKICPFSLWKRYSCAVFFTAHVLQAKVGRSCWKSMRYLLVFSVKVNHLLIHFPSQLIRFFLTLEVCRKVIAKLIAASFLFRTSTQVACTFIFGGGLPS